MIIKLKQWLCWLKKRHHYIWEITFEYDHIRIDYYICSLCGKYKRFSSYKCELCEEVNDKCDKQFINNNE
jgi:hypothetical protein